MHRVTVFGQRHTAFYLRNDNFADRAECLLNVDAKANFVITRSGADSRGPEAMAFPELMLGCAYKICTPHSGLPRQATRLGNPVTSWYTVQRAGGLWNAAYDIWFARTRYYAGQVHGAELMIWLNTTLGRPRWARLVRIGDRRYWFLTWRACHQRGSCWTYLSFRRYHPVTWVNGLRLMPFIRFAEQRKLISPQWWLDSIDAGFEVWNGGRGLGTLSYWAKP